MKILALVDRRYPCDHSFLEGLMERRLTALGHEILWVMQSTSHQQGVTEKEWLHSLCMVLPNRTNRGIYGIFRNYASLLINLGKLRSKFRDFSPDVIFVRNDPAYLLYSVLMARKLDVPIVYQLSHLKEEEVIERLSYVDAKTKIIYILIGAVGKCLRNILIVKCNHVLPISDEMKHYLSYRRKIPLKKMTSVPLGVEDVSSIESSSFEQYKLISGKYLIYVGTMAISRRLDILVDAFEIALTSIPDLKLVFLGGATESGAQEKLMKHVVSKKMENNIIFVPQVPRKEVPYFIKNALLALSTMPAKGVLRMISPTKLMEYLQQGCPVVATRGIPEQDEIVSKSGGGVLVDFLSEDIARGIVYLAMRPAKAAKMGKNGREYILSHRNYDNMVYDVERMFMSVIAHS